jgi:hypothetical protein
MTAIGPVLFFFAAHLFRRIARNTSHLIARASSSTSRAHAPSLWSAVLLLLFDSCYSPLVIILNDDAHDAHDEILLFHFLFGFFLL